LRRRSLIAKKEGSGRDRIPGTVLPKIPIGKYPGGTSGVAMASPLFLAFGAISYCLVLEIL